MAGVPLWLMEKLEPRVQVRAVVSLRRLPFRITVSPQAYLQHSEL